MRAVLSDVAVLAAVVVTVAADVVGTVTSVDAVTAVDGGPASDPDTVPVVVASLAHPAAITTSSPTTRPSDLGAKVSP